MRVRSRVSVVLLVLAPACGRADKPVERPPSKAADKPAGIAAGMPAEMPVVKEVVKPDDKPFVAGPLVHPDSLAAWETVDYKSQSIDGADLKPLPLLDVQHIRAIIFGRHGRIFEDSTLQRWLASHVWYHADKTFTNASLSAQERANLDVVREAEAVKHTQIESGDMRFYETRVLTSAMLGTHSPQDWEVLEAEVLANHGFVFEPDDPTGQVPSDIQRYFDQRYWYARDSAYQAKDLSEIERQNRDTIAVAEMRQLGRGVTPGQMNLFQSTALTEPMLKNTPIADLRLIRNEIYARHGRAFQTPWLADYFRQFPWYRPRADFSDSELSPIEKANIALITTREQQLHDELSTRELTIYEVRGLRPEDARLLRNEIYARHGRRFQDPQLRGYFTSFAWYKQSNGFRDDQLNAIEQKNVKLMADQEKGRFTEG